MYWHLPAFVPVWFRQIMLNFEPVDYRKDPEFIANCKVINKRRMQDDLYRIEIDWLVVAAHVLLTADDMGISPGLLARKIAREGDL